MLLFGKHNHLDTCSGYQAPIMEPLIKNPLPYIYIPVLVDKESISYVVAYFTACDVVVCTNIALDTYYSVIKLFGNLKAPSQQTDDDPRLPPKRAQRSQYQHAKRQLPNLLHPPSLSSPRLHFNRSFRYLLRPQRQHLGLCGDHSPFRTRVYYSDVFLRYCFRF